MRAILATIICLLLSDRVFASAKVFTYEGYLVDSTTSTPVDGSGYAFQYSIYGQPTTGPACLLYAELQTSTITAGHFAAQIGSSSSVTNYGGRSDLSQVFAGGASVVGSGCTFDSTTSGATYYLRVSIYSGGTYVPMSDVAISPAPRAMQADAISGFAVSNLLRVADGSGVPQTAAALTPANFTELLALLNGTSSQYRSSSATLTEAEIPTLVSGGKVSGSAITSGSIAGSTSISTSGNIVTTGSMSASASSTRGLSIYQAAPSSIGVTITAGPTQTANYSLTLPPNAGAVNQVLSSDGSGNLVWTTPSAGVTIGGTAPITIYGTPSAPIVTVADATTAAKGVVQLAADGATGAGTVVQASDGRLSNSRAPTGAAGGDLLGSYPSPTIASAAVTTAKIADGAISTSKLFPNVGINRLIATDGATGTTLAAMTCSAGELLSYNVTQGWMCTSASTLTGTASLAGDVTGTLTANSVATVGGSSAANVHSAEQLANAAVSANTASTLIKRDVSGNFSAGKGSFLSAELRDSASGKLTLSAPSTVTSYSLTFPPAAPSTNGQVLTSTTGGVLSWTTPAGGGVSTVSSANSDITVATGSTTPTLTLNSGTSAGQIVKLDGLAKLPAVDGSALTNLSAASLSSGTVPTNRGGTGLTNVGTANQILGTTAGASGLEYKTLTAGSGISISHTTGSVTISAPQAFVNGGNSFGTAANLGTNENQTLSLRTNGTTRMLFDTSGNAGIGTTTLSSMLTVNGKVEAKSGGFVFPDNSVQTSAVQSSQNVTGNGAALYQPIMNYTANGTGSGSSVTDIYATMSYVGASTGPSYVAPVYGSLSTGAGPSGTNAGGIFMTTVGASTALTSGVYGGAILNSGNPGFANGVTGIATSNVASTTGNIAGGYFSASTNYSATGSTYGIYVSGVTAPNANRFSIYTSDANAPSVFTGAVAIGQGTAPAAALEVTGDVRDHGQLYVIANSADSKIFVGPSSSSNANASITLTGKNSGAATAGAVLQADYDGNLMFRSGPLAGSVDFQNGNGVSQLYLRGNGNVGIGVTNPTYQLQLNTDSAAKPGTGTWTIASDERLKDIRAPFSRGLAALEGIHPIYFRYKKDNPLGLPSTNEYVGIKAQDALAVVPEAVSQDEKGYYHVTTDAILWTIFNAVKELAAKAAATDVDQLRAENASLKEENRAIKAWICAKDPAAAVCAQP